MNIVLPAAGKGKRFADAGYTLPKPFIPVNGIPMIQKVIENIDVDGCIYLVAHIDHASLLEPIVDSLGREIIVVYTNTYTRGAAETVLLGTDAIRDCGGNLNDPLFIVDSDNLVESVGFTSYIAHRPEYDGIIQVTRTTDPAFSYVKMNENYAEEVAEKKVISEFGAVGRFYWKHTKDYIKYATAMIKENRMQNGEFYVCPTYQEAINDNKRIGIFEVQKMHCLGTPDYLKVYEENFNAK